MPRVSGWGLVGLGQAVRTAFLPPAELGLLMLHGSLVQHILCMRYGDRQDDTVGLFDGNQIGWLRCR